MTKFLTKEIKLWQTILFCLLAGMGVYYFLSVKQLNSSDDVVDEKTSTKINFIRDKNSYQLTKPLIGIDMDKPSTNLTSVQGKMQSILDKNQEDGLLASASIYLRSLESGEWTSINDGEKFHPGSLIKVPMLMYYLKEAEENPMVLDLEYSFDEKYKLPNQTFNDKTIKPGGKYKIRELLKYMVCYSDNCATAMLNDICNVPKFQKIFEDHGLEKPNVYNKDYSISVKEYSVFMRSLYNATYLSPQNSEMALQLLTESTFDAGMSAKIPGDVKVANKFGESFQANSNIKELHECGIIFCNRKPFLLVVMTRGTDSKKQAGVISNLSNTIFSSFCS
jgi:beta-lactamase class A